ncbi:hypothetical protein [Geomesophilobacter sediminis]|uniref:Cardiolipin synthase N-terminal domain-containing protein n=1 Tax=Geomesophilobacter sediminis TaxID=2798584 RepID=A0A8J7JM53_9BACT|nr:hypothetical protein [Geomesophilobacter sediminis]MBJ6725525.1 hypothetical protein [Geomesophilobacter sediminis]
MQLANIKFGLLLAGGALATIFLCFVIYYTLYEISSNRSLKGVHKFKWSALAILLPGIGSFSYFLLAQKPEYAHPVKK